MNKKQIACEAVLHWDEAAAEAKKRQGWRTDLRGKIVSVSFDEKGDTATVLAKKFGTSKGYVGKYRKMFLEDKEAFDYVHQTGKDIPRLRVNGVYLISAGIPGPTKIGKTDNLEMRLCSIQTGSWQKLEVVKWMPIEQPEWFERELHYLFQGKRLHGEWFELNERDVDLIDQFYQREIAAPTNLA